MTTTIDMANGMGQLELAFSGTPSRLGPAPGERRLTRAAWWFQQMHRVANQAFDWRPAPPPRPRQEWLPRMSGELRFEI
ncbi:MAG TPA: hypothetical protein PK640_15010 [Verrucomicrobiota bacterium]|nr:hypothetical protein [Verrucomicrobiota bacterium]